MPSLSHLLILIAVIVLLFGTKKLRTLGEDLGAAIKGFKKAMGDENETKDTPVDPVSIEKKDPEIPKNE